ncbi:hypothetical protein PoB_002560700 [Plakobranchus ocellatus]|uniref:Uncharacterized protein n=1 Tax=Plakobranchus ocellatus TaxID=259542 RepID=A0AAV3ZWN3_9GAST|nr:hypothetical protein PoB_002560700 [Plakobranchus ocellatus]
MGEVRGKHGPMVRAFVLNYVGRFISQVEIMTSDRLDEDEKKFEISYVLVLHRCLKNMGEVRGKHGPMVRAFVLNYVGRFISQVEIMTSDRLDEDEKKFEISYQRMAE